MDEYIITIAVGVMQIILSISLVIRRKNGIAIFSEVISSIVLLYILNGFSIDVEVIPWRYVWITIAEYVFVKVFLVIFMIWARRYSFYLIKELSRKKRKIKSNGILKLIKRFYNAKYWPRLKLGLPGMANRTHAVTKVRFDSEGFPKFKAYYTVQLRRKDFRKTREQHFYIANKMLYKKILSSSRLKAKFSRKEIKALSQGKTPDKYTWHHHQDAGKLQLVDQTIHEKTSHNGGYSIWGGK